MVESLICYDTIWQSKIGGHVRTRCVKCLGMRLGMEVVVPLGPQPLTAPNLSVHTHSEFCRRIFISYYGMAAMINSACEREPEISVVLTHMINLDMTLGPLVLMFIFQDKEVIVFVLIVFVLIILTVITARVRVLTVHRPRHFEIVDQSRQPCFHLAGTFL